MVDRQRDRQRYWNSHDKHSYKCPDCGRSHNDVNGFEVHHIDGDPSNGDIENLVALCRECHLDRHGEWIGEVYGDGRRRQRRNLRRRLE